MIRTLANQGTSRMLSTHLDVRFVIEKSQVVAGAGESGCHSVGVCECACVYACVYVCVRVQSPLCQFKFVCACAFACVYMRS